MTSSAKTWLILLLLTAGSFDTATAMTVFMNDESEIEAQSAWQDGEKILVRVSSELSLDFPVSEVNVQKSGITNAQQKRVVPARVQVPARQGDVLDELVEVAGHRRDFNDIFGRTGRGEFEQLLSDTFSPAVAEKSFKRSLERKLDQRELAVVLAWYKSPVGLKIAEADSIWDFNRREKTLTYAGMESVPGHKERMKLVAEIEKVAGASEMETRLTKNIFQKMMNAIPPGFPDAEEIKERMKKDIPTVESKRKENIDMWAYSYRDLSLAELREYLQFLRSPTGKKYMSAVQEGTEEIFKKVAVTIENDFRQDLMKLMK